MQEFLHKEIELSQDRVAIRNIEHELTTQHTGYYLPRLEALKIIQTRWLWYVLGAWRGPAAGKKRSWLPTAAGLLVRLGRNQISLNRELDQAGDIMDV